MQKMGRWLAVLGGIFGSAAVVHAHCPLCTAAIGVGILGARAFGLSDSIVGLFVGAFAVSTGIWFSRKLGKKVPLQTPLLIGGSWLLTIIPLQALSRDMFYLPIFWLGQSGGLLNQAYFPSFFLAGGLVGALVSLFALQMHEWMKRKHGRVLVPFQGIWLTLGLLVITSLLFMAGGL